MSKKIIRGILVSLLNCDGQPMPEDALVIAAQIMCRPDSPTDADVADKMKTLASEGFISGATDELTRDRFWELTMPKGVMKARQMR